MVLQQFLCERGGIGDRDGISDGLVCTQPGWFMLERHIVIGDLEKLSKRRVLCGRVHGCVRFHCEYVKSLYRMKTGVKNKPGFWVVPQALCF